MKKLFLFTVALLTSLMVGATTYTLEPGENKISGIINTLAEGDVIELQTGTYIEWNSLIFNTKVTIKAAEGAAPKLSLYNWKIQNDFEINGIEITNVSKDNYLFRVYESVAGTVAFKNCSMQLNADVTAPQAYIIVKSEKSLGQLEIDNCLFMDNAKSQGAVICASGSTTNVTNFIMKNSTAYNCGTELTVWFEGLVNAYVEHCTFYNCGTRELYLKASEMNDYLVQNCVVANATAPESSNYCIASYAGGVKNCVYYNVGAPRGEGANVTNCANADPQFIDPANGNFNFAFTSPIFLAATDDSNIGDPRWGVEVGEDAIDIPGTLPLDAAVLNGTKISKTAEAISWSENDTKSFASFVINATKSGKYNVVLTETTSSGHNYKVSVIDIDGNILSVAEGQNTWESGALTLGQITIPENGNYLVRLENLTSYSASSISAFQFTYAGGAVIDIPATLPNEEALLIGSKISRTADGIKWGDNEDITEDYATWNISVAEGGDYLVTMAVKTGETSGHEFFIKIFNGDSQQVGETITETTKTPINLAAGTYTVHLGNNKKWSSAVMASVAIKSASGTVVDMPGTLQAGDALLGGDDKVKVDGDGYICFSKNENVPNCWATWQTNWVKTGTYDVILDVNATNGHKLVVEVLDGETVIETFKYGYSTESGKLSIGKFVLSETKSYTIRLTNEQTWSDARIKSIAFIPFITIGNDDTNVDFTEYENQFVSVQFNRTFTGGMYNPICVPFAVNEKKLEAIFGVNKAYYLDVNNTYMDGQKLFINLKADGGIYQGVPYFVAPATNVVNPIFHNVQISQVNAQATNVSDVIKLQGNYSKEELPKPTLSLLLGANNALFFPSDETPYVKSMRAYFELPSEEVKKAIRHISLSDGYNAPTWMEVQNAECTMHNGKFIRDGRFVIVREGKEYNALGVGR